jgi:hypothetical protein
MGLSRLDNFLKSVRGTIIYVDPNSLDSTDSIENQGNSLTRPFKTIQRALAEAARFSYQRGLNNDRFAKTTILVYPGDHVVDNRPGWIPDGVGSFRLRNGTTSSDFPAWDLTTNYDLTSTNNALYKLNSINGGVIIPRGTSIVGLDLRKTKIRPKYVPNPVNNNIERSTIFRVTGACYFWQFSIFDGDPNGQVYTDYTTNLLVPNFSHHKLTCFEYADGKNDVTIDDTFQTYSTDRTDLDMYYEKIGLAYGQSSGRAIEPDYPSAGLDIQPKIDEYRIVGPTSGEVGISSIKAGDGVVSSTNITVTTTSAVDGLDVDTGFRIRGITTPGYNGQFVVSEKLSSTQFKYQLQNAPSIALPDPIGASLTLATDTVSSASPYVFNISLRSVFGMCGMLADGSKADGFKSMMVAQFTGIGLQKDDNAFVVYNETTGLYDDNTAAGNETISTNSRAIYKPEYKNFHIKAINEAFIQNVSIFAIGFAEQFVTESGGDMSITNSNSNFGAKALVSQGFRNSAFPQDDVGYISHIIPPKQIANTEVAFEFNAIDVSKTVGVASTGHLYLYNQTNVDVPPTNVIEGYRVGARQNDQLKALISVNGTVSEYFSRIVMPNTQTSSEKISIVGRSIGGINSITDSTLTFNSAHSFLDGESVRIFSNNGHLPDGISQNQTYYAITNANVSSGITTNVDIKLAKTEADAVSYSTSNLTNIDFNDNGGLLTVVSRVSDKNSGDIGHPIQYDVNENQWYINVSTASTENTIYSTIVSLGSTSLGEATPRTFIRRKQDNRNAVDTLYRVRYVIPSSAAITAKPPTEGFILQESNTSIGSTSGEIQTYFGNGSIGNVNEQRNFKFIAGANWNSNTANILTEIPHNLSLGSEVELIHIKSSNNTTGVAYSGFNGIYSVTGISSSKQFSVGINTDPGSFTNDTNTRDTFLPYYKRKSFDNTYYVYGAQEVQEYISGKQDGIYHLTILNGSNAPNVTPFTGETYSQPIKELYPQTNRDNPESDPAETVSFAIANPIGQVIVDDVRGSITRETLTKVVRDINIGVGITNIVTSVGGTIHTIHTSIDHGLNRITQVSVANSGAGYGSGVGGDIYNARLVGIGTSTTGLNATAKISFNSFGNITNVRIMDGGSAFEIGNTLAIVGVATTAGFSQADVQVTKIYNNIDDVVRIVGVSSNIYNTLGRITSVGVGSATSFVIQSADALSGVTTSPAGVGPTATLNSFAYLTGESVKVSSISYNNNVGIATITTLSNHGLSVDKKIRLAGANQNIYNSEFVVTRINSLTSVSVNIGVTDSAPAATGEIYILPEGFASNDGVVTPENENLSGRQVYPYAGITTTLSAQISNTNTDQIEITNIQDLDINIGDYLSIGNEILRVKTTITGTPSNPIYVFRGVLGTKASTHTINSVVRKVRPLPVEMRRHSILRASGHTFEYVGFGPGNYSTAFPDKQNRQISSEEELLAQSTRRNGGINFYTGMNDRGASFNGNRKLSTVTGKEEIFDTPIQTITGEDISNLSEVNVISPIEGNFSRSIRVEGGSDGNTISEFNGPVIFTNKVSSTSTKGLEANSLFLQGDSVVSRKYTVGVSAPTLSGNPGDIVYYENPSKGEYVGWIYTTDNDWYRFGNVSISKDSNIGIFDKVGIATTSPGDCTLKVGSGTSLFCVDGDGVGIGATNSGYKLNVNGTINGIFVGDGSGITNLNAGASGWAQVGVGLGTGIYSTTERVGIGTTVPQYNLHLGRVGTGNTDLYVENKSIFNGQVTTQNVSVGGIITATSYRLAGGTGTINAGIVTTSTLNVGSNVIRTTATSVGIGTETPRANLDIEGSVRFKSYSEAVIPLSISSGNVNIDLSQGQTFTLTVSAVVSQFTLLNSPSGSTAFSILITQNAVGHSVGIDTFRTSGGSTIPVYWPGGGVVPIVTTVANKTDMYSFKTFDGGASLYGIVGGQNFA